MRQEYTLTKRGDTWYYLAYDETGKRKKFSTGLSTKSAANAFCLKKAKEGLLIPGASLHTAFREFAEPFWIWGRCPIVTDKIEREYHFSQTLCKNNRGCMEKNILPAFGSIRVEDITSEMINDWLLKMRKPRKIGDKLYPPLANSTANKMLRILREMLDVAVRRKMIKENPAREVGKLNDKYKKRGAFSILEAQLILGDSQAWDNPMAWLGSYLSAMTGMRQGEIRALCASDIVNFAQKFHSNVIRAVWNADNSEIVVHPVSYMSLTVTLN